MAEMVPTIGRIVHYTLSEQDAEQINERRGPARSAALGGDVQMHHGNYVQARDVYPMVITRVWGDQPDSEVNGQVLLDGNDTLWATSVTAGEGERHFVWPQRA
jgi:hypothetical protein